MHGWCQKARVIAISCDINNIRSALFDFCHKARVCLLKLNIGKCKVMSYSMREQIQTQYFIYDDNNQHYLENLHVNFIRI